MTPSRSLRLGVVALLAGALAAPLPTTLASATEVPAPAPVEIIAPTRVERIGGTDRYAVSAAISEHTFSSSTPVPVAYVVSGEGFADALSASALAGHLGGPVLLVHKDSVPQEISAELSRIDPVKIVILGGLNTISEAVRQDLRRFAPTVVRIDGPNRYEVSAAASASAYESTSPTFSVPVAYIASGESYPDALSGSARAGKLGGPVLLTQKSTLPESVKHELGRLNPQRIVVLGGGTTIDDSVIDELREIQPVTDRLAGGNRYETSVLISQGFQAMTDTVVVASGAVYPDALSGGPAAIADGGPVVLVDPAGISKPVADELTRLAPKRIVVLGGPNTVPQTVVDALAAYIRP